jgi:hypothetical protein
MDPKMSLGDRFLRGLRFFDFFLESNPWRLVRGFLIAILNVLLFCPWGIYASFFYEQTRAVGFACAFSCMVECLQLFARFGVFSFEDIRIRKQARGAANRAINCDEHNFQRMLDAADTQVEGIRRYVIAKGMRSLPPALQEIAQKRLDNADLSLVELGQQFEPPLSKSAVNHRMRRLMDIVREHEQQTIQEYREEAQEEKP